MSRALSFALGAAYVVWLLATTSELGYTRDEGMYFDAARVYRAWFELFVTEPGRALEQSSLDRYFGVNREHPALMKLAFAFSHWLLHEELGVCGPGTAYRFPAMLLGGLSVSVLSLWGTHALGLAGGVFAALAFAFLPRVFFHAHLACFDLPVAALWLLTAYCYARSLESKCWGFSLATGVSFGLLLDTKQIGWFFPLAVVLHALAAGGWSLWRTPRRWPLAWAALLVVGPLVFYAGWPWLWPDPLPRLAEYVRFHLDHHHYNIEFLGITYSAPPFPRTYAPLMTLATVPFITLLCAGAGAWLALRDGIRSFPASDLAGPASIRLLWVVGVLVSYSPWLSSSTPIYGGTKHWLAAYPFLCLLAASGYSAASASLIRHWPALRRRPVAIGLAAALLLGPCVMTMQSHPFGLSAYTPLVGGAPGAATLGLNRTFWGYTTGSLTPSINRLAPPGADVYLHDTLSTSFRMLRADGVLRADLEGTLRLERSELALYHHEPHMRRVEAQIWALYGTTAPESVALHDGVPVAWVYARRARSQSSGASSTQP